VSRLVSPSKKTRKKKHSDSGRLEEIASAGLIYSIHSPGGDRPLSEPTWKKKTNSRVEGVSQNSGECARGGGVVSTSKFRNHPKKESHNVEIVSTERITPGYSLCKEDG